MFYSPLFVEKDELLTDLVGIIFLSNEDINSQFKLKQKDVSFITYSSSEPVNTYLYNLDMSHPSRIIV